MCVDAMTPQQARQALGDAWQSHWQIGAARKAWETTQAARLAELDATGQGFTPEAYQIANTLYDCNSWAIGTLAEQIARWCGYDNEVIF